MRTEPGLYRSRAARIAAGLLLTIVLLGAGGLWRHAVHAAVEEGNTNPEAKTAALLVERFDVKKGEVTERSPVTPEIRQEAERLIQAMGGHAGTFRVDPKDGIVLRIPLQPSLEIRKPGFYALSTEVFLFLPEGVAPYVLVFSEENEPRLFALGQSADKLLQLCGWPSSP